MSENKSKSERQYQILEAAMSVFISKGYHKTRMDDIVKVSGLSKGALYHHYESKNELFLSLIDHWETYSFPDFYSKNGKMRTASETLIDFSKAVFDLYSTKKEVFLAEVEFWALSVHDNEIKRRSKSLYEKLLNLFELVLEKGIRNGEFVKIDTKTYSLMILTSFQGINWFCVFGEDKITPSKYLEQSIDIILEKIRKK